MHSSYKVGPANLFGKMQHLTIGLFSSPFGKEELHLLNSWGELGAGRSESLKLSVDRPCEVRRRTPSPVASRQVRDKGQNHARRIRMRTPALQYGEPCAGYVILPAPSPPQVITRSHLRYAASPSSHREQANIITRNPILSTGLRYLRKVVKMVTFRPIQIAQERLCALLL